MKIADIYPCPFCGKTVKTVYITEDNGAAWVRCVKCKIDGPITEITNKEFEIGMTREDLAWKAINKWNSRTPWRYIPCVNFRIKTQQDC